MSKNGFISNHAVQHKYPVKMSKQLYFKQSILAYVRFLNVKIVLFQAIQFNISTQFSSIQPKDWTLPFATTPAQSGPGSDEGTHRITQSSSITWTSPSNCLMSVQDIRRGILLL